MATLSRSDGFWAGAGERRDQSGLSHDPGDDRRNRRRSGSRDDPRSKLRIGLEIHARLCTASKLFCGCANAYGAPPNRHVCPVCLGLPGTLPVLNRGALARALRVAGALGCEIAGESRFARKHYFYPDLPRNFQITQYDRPLAQGGRLPVDLDGNRAVSLQRIHLEEDAGRVVQPGETDAPWRIDLNRAGTPLVEIVTAPDLESGEEARDCVAHLRLILRYLGVGEANLEDGSLRCDVNISLATTSGAPSARVELKNLNSLRAIAAAVAYEARRQGEQRQRGIASLEETRSWDPGTGRTVALRGKEETEDYRYLDEPDLPPVLVTRARIEAIRKVLPELPGPRYRRYRCEYGLGSEDATVIVETPSRAAYFEEVATGLDDPHLAARWIRGEMLALARSAGETADSLPIPPQHLVDLLARVRDGALHRALAKEVLAEMVATGVSAAAVIERHGLRRVAAPGALRATVAGVLAEHEREVVRYRRGKAGVLNFLVGQVMARTRGQADPEVVKRLLRDELAAEDSPEF